MTIARPERRFRTGLIGAGIGFSSSPRIHMDEAASLGLDYRYELFDLDHEPDGAAALPRLLDAAERSGFAGVNITYPCKQTVLPLLDELSDDARRLQSVNTVVFSAGKRQGHNTDWWGFAENFRRFLTPVAMNNVVLVGAGGAGAAVAYALLKLGTASLLINDSDSSRAAMLASRLAGQFPDRSVAVASDLPAALAIADGLVHATPVGMSKLPGIAVPAECVQPPLWVADIVYVPLETQLLALARQRGCRVLNGGGMAVLQAARAFEHFSGMTADIERMLSRFAKQVLR